MMIIKCDKCNYETKKHWTIKGCRREIRKQGGLFNGGAILCPKCKEAQTLKISF